MGVAQIDPAVCGATCDRAALFTARASATATAILAKIATVILFFYSVLLFPFLSTYYYTSIFVLNHYYTNINALCYCRECNEDERGVCAYALKGHCEGR